MGGRRVIRVRPAGEESAAALENLVAAHGRRRADRARGRQPHAALGLRALAETEACLAALPCYMDNEAALEGLVESAARARRAAASSRMRWTGSSSGWAAIAARPAARSTSCCSTRQATAARPSRWTTPSPCWATAPAIGIDDVIAATFDGELRGARSRARPRVRRGRQPGAARARRCSAMPTSSTWWRATPPRAATSKRAMFKARGLPRGGPVRQRFERHVRAWPLRRLSDAVQALLEGRTGVQDRPGYPDEAITRRDFASRLAQVGIARRGSAVGSSCRPPVLSGMAACCGQDQEGEALLDVEPHALAVVVEVADREILADRQLEIAAAQRDHQAAVEARRPHDLAVDQALDVAQDRIAAVGARGEILVELLVQHHGERAFDAVVAQLGEGGATPRRDSRRGWCRAAPPRWPAPGRCR